MAYDEERYGQVVSHEQDLFTTYDVTNKSFCVNEKRKKLTDVMKVVEEQAKEILNDENFDYWGRSGILPKDYLFPAFHWLAIYYVPGGSEGYFVHIDTISRKDAGPEWENLWVAKTLYEGEKGREVCEELIKKLHRIMYR